MKKENICKSILVIWWIIMTIKYLKKNIGIKSNINLNNGKVLIKFFKKHKKSLFPNFEKRWLQKKNPFVS